MASSPGPLSPESSPSPREVIDKTRTNGSPQLAATPASGTTGSSMKEVNTPLSDRTAPPTLEELEAMDREKVWKEAEQESATQSVSNVSENSKYSSNQGLGRTFSRQVSRISGTGRPATALQHLRKPSPSPVMGVPEPTSLIAGATPVRRGRIEREYVSPEDEHLPGMNLRGRLATNLEQDVCVPPSVSGPGPGPTRNRPVDNCNSEQLSAQQAPTIAREPSMKAIQIPKASEKEPLHHQQRPDISPQQTRLEPFDTQGFSSACEDQIKLSKQPQHTSALIDGGGIGGGRGKAGPAGVSSKAQPQRRVTADSDMDVEVEEVEQSPNSGNSSCGSPRCWGGGLPPIRNTIAQGPPAARAAAARAPLSTVRYAEARHPEPRHPDRQNQRYPSSDKDSFARTLKDDELDELWKGLGEGVSQRGGGSEVAFEAHPAPSPAGTAASGAFPKLTANVLEKHDKLAGDGKRRQPNVMPMPKDVGDKALQGMENGRAQSSKKSQGSSIREQQSLLGLIILYGVFVAWMAHLVFNVLLLRDAILEDHQYLWALCFAPGVLGTLLSLRTCCRNGHLKCKSAVDEEGYEEEEEDSIPNGPHACALPAHVFLLILVVVSLGMHSSAMLFCENGTELFLEESTVEPLCDENSLLLPVVLDAVLLMVASLKASSLCWAWVLS